MSNELIVERIMEGREDMTEPLGVLPGRDRRKERRQGRRERRKERRSNLKEKIGDMRRKDSTKLPIYSRRQGRRGI